MNETIKNQPKKPIVVDKEIQLEIEQATLVKSFHSKNSSQDMQREFREFRDMFKGEELTKEEMEFIKDLKKK